MNNEKWLIRYNQWIYYIRPLKTHDVQCDTQYTMRRNEHMGGPGGEEVQF